MTQYENKEDFLLFLQKIRADLKQFIQKRTRLVTLLVDVAFEIQKHENNSRIAQLSGDSASIVGTCLAIAGGGCVCHFGASLPLTIAGISLSLAGATTSKGAQQVTTILQSIKVKEAEEALQEDFRIRQRLQNEIGHFYLFEDLFDATDICNNVVGICDAAGLFDFQFFPDEIGVIFNGVALGFSIHSLITTSIDVHKGSIVKVVKDIDEIAQKLLNTIENIEHALIVINNFIDCNN
ncbi:uncharacterized protein LOC124449845 [Xenia sp. Carnegie-2017]|uniref:uncharacterized protein LOC124449845 n=1 Tax=Xenia sp. Carnegie-2017 TaxID=2897299 RepID=UPI001F039416|nr:uncharacterized protein LOC124449845 [Xenia sp. Carnegie-2017]